MSYRYGEDDAVTKTTDELITKYGEKLSNGEIAMIKSWKTLGSCRAAYERAEMLAKLEHEPSEEELDEIAWTHTPSVYAKEAAILLGVTKETVRKWAHQRKIKYASDTLNMHYYDLESVLVLVDSTRIEKGSEEHEEKIELEDI